jgi:glycosyltransferase involved in cell wall biosynthesis
MKTAIIIPTYNRPEYLKKCFESLADTYIAPETLIYIIDDASTNKETIKLIKAFDKEGCEIKKQFIEGLNGVYHGYYFVKN